MDNSRAHPANRAGAAWVDPEARARRWRLFRQLAAAGVARQSLVPPLSIRQLFDRADRMAATNGLHLEDDHERKALAILIHNQAWRETVAGIPFERRLLLLPQCLRTRAECPAVLDEWGLLCQECGRCPLGALQQEAVALGYATLIAEGTSAVSGLLKEGKLDAVIGASCLPALEQSFRHIAEEAVPALAIPLLRDGCDATVVDLDWLYDAIRLRTQTTVRSRISVDELRGVVRTWFAPDSLRSLLGRGDHHPLTVAVDWVAAAGKRWRPLLAVAVYDALRNASGSALGELPRTVAVAAECFHKASLIHDDIEDDDDLRDGAATLHKQYGVPVALNVGDLLLGEGYRLLAHAPAEPAMRLALLTVAAEGHRRLCIGQGEELHWRGRSALPTVPELIGLFRLKTAPAFEVALLLGAMAGGADTATCASLTRFSQALGVAYQIRDDLLDMEQDADWETGCMQRPSIMLVLLHEKADAGERTRMLDRLRHGGVPAPQEASLRHLCARYGIVAQTEKMQADYRARALQAIEPLQSVWLKSVLVRLVKRILPVADS